MNKKIQKIISKHTGLVTVSCDEYHSHSATQNCLLGPSASIDVLILAEYIHELETKIEEIANMARWQ